MVVGFSICGEQSVLGLFTKMHIRSRRGWNVEIRSKCTFMRLDKENHDCIKTGRNFQL